MTKDEGENLLRTCLNQIDASLEISDLIYYKSGNRKKASDYNGNEISTSLEPDEITKIKGKIPVVVKCFCHMGIYVAWDSSIGFGNGKYCVYKSSLENFEKDQESTYKVMSIGTRDIDKVYFFRGEDGINVFFKNVLQING